MFNFLTEISTFSTMLANTYSLHNHHSPSKPLTFKEIGCFWRRRRVASNITALALLKTTIC